MSKSLYSSPEAKQKIMEIYDEKLHSLPIEQSSKYVETAFGKTHMVLAGNPQNPPLVLLHGANAGAPIALESMVEFTKDYYVYAIDIVGQPNRSAETVIPMKTDEYGRWLNEVLDKLELKNVPIIAVSLGGLVSYKAAILDNTHRISKLILLVPAGIVNGNPLVGLFQVFYPMKRYMQTQKDKFLYKFLDALFTEEDEYAVKSLSQIFLHFTMDFSPIPTLKKSEGEKIKIPVYIIGADQDKFFPGKKMIKQVAKVFPTLQQTLLLENSKHVPAEHHKSTYHSFMREALKLNNA